MSIARITKAYVRHYSDNGQTKAGVEWIDHNGKAGCTEGGVIAKTGTLAEVYGVHMGALMARAICNGVEIEHETW